MSFYHGHVMSDLVTQKQREQQTCFVSANSRRIRSTYMMRCAGLLWLKISVLNLLSRRASSSASWLRATSDSTSFESE